MAAPFEHADVHLFTSAETAVEFRGQCQVFCHIQESRSFGRSLEAAVDKLAEMGYREIAIVGRDCPQLTDADVTTAFQRLNTHRLVLGPDHKGGVYLIAFRSSDRDFLKGIRWRRNTDCQQLRNRFGRRCTLLLNVKQDLDDSSDLRLFGSHNIQWLLRVIIGLFGGAVFGRSAGRSRQFLDCERLAWQLPPPLPFSAIRH